MDYTRSVLDGHIESTAARCLEARRAGPDACDRPDCNSRQHPHRHHPLQRHDYPRASGKVVARQHLADARAAHHVRHNPHGSGPGSRDEQGAWCDIVDEVLT